MKRLLFICCSFCSFGSFGQFTDDFTDGDFTTNPVWSGDDVKFSITSGELNSQNSGALTYYLSTPSTLATEAEWEFFINLKFSTSGANFVDVYLMSDNAALTAATNGYFVRVGTTPDEISFYKVVAGVESKIIDGVDGSVNSSSNNPFNIRVSRDASDLWLLETDDGAIGTYTAEGSVTDSDVNTSTHFGVKIKQSSAASPINKHFFDNFSVSPIVPDLIPPVISIVTIISNTEIDLKFNEDVDQATVETITNYIIDNGIGQPVSATQDGVDNSLVHLIFTNSFSNTSYQITVQNVEDLNGNAIISTIENFDVVIPELAAVGDVMINELMVDPTPEVGLPNSEYVEIYNRSNKYIDLANYTLNDKVITIDTEIIAPDQHIILCEIDNMILLQSFGTVIGLSSWNTLTNGGESVTLNDIDNSLIIDELSYDLSWYTDAEKEEGGWSLERINPDHQCSDENNWSSSDDALGGTPGIQNSVFDNTPDLEGPLLLSAVSLSTDSLKVSFDERLDTVTFSSTVFTFDPVVGVDTIYVETDLKSAIVVFSELLQSSVDYTVSVTGLSDCTGNIIENDQSATFLLTSIATRNDIIINEIMADPTPEVGLPNSEYVELYNRSTLYFDLVNFTLNDEIIATTNYILAPGDYMLLMPEAQISLFAGITNVVGISSWDVLTNSGEKITLKNNNGNLIDQLAFDLGWHTDANKDDGGWSLEQINPDHQCSDENNWSSSNDALGGTPGTENSVFDDTPDLTGPVLLSAISLSADSLKVTFDERLDTTNFAAEVFTFDPMVVVDTIYLEADLKTAIIVFFELLQTSVNYTVSVTGLRDCSGNIIRNDQKAAFLLTSIAMSNDIIINEIMADPTPEFGLPNSEYVEIYNRSGAYFDLVNFTLNGEVVTTSNYIFAPGEYILLVPEEQIPKFAGISNVIGISNWDVLTNSGEQITLKNNNGNLIDQLAFDLGWHTDANKDDGGWSLERINPDHQCSDENNWSSSDDALGGTPGIQNAVLDDTQDVTGPILLTAIPLSTDS